MQHTTVRNLLKLLTQDTCSVSTAESVLTSAPCIMSQYIQAKVISYSALQIDSLYNLASTYTLRMPSKLAVNSNQRRIRLFWLQFKLFASCQDNESKLTSASLPVVLLKKCCLGNDSYVMIRSTVKTSINMCMVLLR